MLYNVKINGKQYQVEVEQVGAVQPVAQQPVMQMQQPVQPVAQQPVMQVQQPAQPVAQPVAQPAAQPAASEVIVESPMPGNVFNINVSVGQQVAAGECLVILEAMKMENEVVAPSAGVVKQIMVSKGTSVDTDDVLVVLN